MCLSLRSLAEYWHCINLTTHYACNLVFLNRHMACQMLHIITITTTATNYGGSRQPMLAGTQLITGELCWSQGRPHDFG